MSDVKAALINVHADNPQLKTIPKLKVFEVKEKLKTPKWIDIDGLQTISKEIRIASNLFLNAKHEEFNLFIFSNNAHETFLKLHNVVGMKFLFTLNQIKANEIVRRIKTVRALRSLRNTKREEIEACTFLEIDTVLKASEIKKFTTQKNNAEKNKDMVEKLMAVQHAEIAKLLNNGWR